jgi:hypothetical protein
MTKKKTEVSISPQARAQGHSLERDREAFVRYHVQHESFQEIADAMGYGSRRTAQRAVDRHLQRFNDESRDHLAIALSKLYEIQRTASKEMTEGGQDKRQRWAEIYIRTIGMEVKITGVSIERHDITSGGQTIPPPPPIREVVIHDPTLDESPDGTEFTVIERGYKGDGSRYDRSR